MFKKNREEEETLEENLKQQNRANLRAILKLPKNLKRITKRTPLLGTQQFSV
jgi:hypothetical protein